MLVGPLIALLLSVVAGGIFILSIGQNPIEVYTRFIGDSLGNAYGIGQILFKATPLMFTGLAAAICFKANLFNIGAEGQMTIGAFLTGLVGSYFQGLPGWILLPASLVAGMAGGAAWGIIPGYLKARFGAHEVINTIMMNFIAMGVVSYFITNIVGVPATVHTPEISPSTTLARLESFFPVFHGSPVNLSFFIAVVICLGAYIFLTRTPRGYEIRALGLNAPAAEYARIPIRKNIIITFALAGACAGLGGMNFILGYKHYFELGFSEGSGFIGIAVALLARNNPIGIIVTSLFFGMLEYGSLTINTIVPKELSNILQAIVILLMITLTKVLGGWIERKRSPEPTNA
ncbi:MAG TPA: ABC transporter permease [Bacteroidota bacterium]|nr:ABC transporter permease [Bacteroidota bacterium]